MALQLGSLRPYSQALDLDGLKKLARDKHLSLLGPFVSYEKKCCEYDPLKQAGSTCTD